MQIQCEWQIWIWSHPAEHISNEKLFHLLSTRSSLVWLSSLFCMLFEIFRRDGKLKTIYADRKCIRNAKHFIRKIRTTWRLNGKLCYWLSKSKWFLFSHFYIGKTEHSFLLFTINQLLYYWMSEEVNDVEIEMNSEHKVKWRKKRRFFNNFPDKCIHLRILCAKNL